MTVHITPPASFRPAMEAAGCFIESDGDLLYMKRAESRAWPNTWNAPGGKLESGEDPRTCVIREIYEEAGLFIDTPDLQYLGPTYIRLPDLDYVFHIFRKSFAKRPSITLNTDEHTEARWVAPPILLPLIPGGLGALEFYLSKRPPHIQKRASFTLIGISLRTDNEKAAHDIPKHWERFYKEQILAQIPKKKSDDVYGLYTDYEGDHTKPYTLIIGCEVDSHAEAPPGFALKRIPAAAYARFPVSGPFPESIWRAWQKVWQSNLQRSYASDFELYGPSFQKDQSLDLFISVK